jgi:histidinol phosphatase-like enzyme (inositol monophosphatase family)
MTELSELEPDVAVRAEKLPKLAALASEQTLAHFRKSLDVQDKSAGTTSERYDPVTVADKAAEEAIRAAIVDAFPNDGIVGEEFGAKEGTSGFQWVIDPIDGTRAYVCGAPTWGTLIAVLQGSRAVAGLMEQPFTRERFIGVGGTAWFTHAGSSPVQISTSGKDNLADAFLSTTAPELFNPARNEHEAFNAVKAATRQVRYGLDCYAYCLLAAGTLDVVVEAGLNSYDIAALVPIVEGAGGIVTTWSGEHPEDGGQILASANPALHEQALELLRTFASR